MRLKEVLSLLILSLSLLIYSCSSEAVYEKNIPVDSDGWKLTDTLIYSLTIQDTSEKYNLAINIRHRDIFSYMNLYVKVITILPDQTLKKDLVSLPLCDEGGFWLGNCSGDICFQRVYILKKIKFSKPGMYIFKINQEMRTEELQNIFDIGIRLEKVKKKVYREDEV